MFPLLSKPYFPILLIVSAGFLLYLPGINVQRYGDDIQLILSSPPLNPFYFFFNTHPSTWYRPLEFNFEAVTQRVFGLTTIPVHIAGIFSHLLLVAIIYSFALRLGFKKIQATLAAAFFLFSQANVHPVTSNDTLSQVWSALFGFLSIYFLYNYLNPATLPDLSQRQKPSAFFSSLLRTTYYPLLTGFLSLLAFAMALLSKEAAIAFLPIIFSFIIFYPSLLATAKSEGRMYERLKQVFIQIAPYLLIAVLYLLIRANFSSMPPSFGPGRYQFHLGLNILQNFAQLLFAMFVPISSVTAFVTLASREWLGFLATACVTIILFALTVWGASRAKNGGLMRLLGASAILAFFPIILLNHVSELHVYNIMPFVAIILGVAFGEIWEICKINKVLRVIFIAIIALLFASNIYAVEAKLALMKQSGERTTFIMAQLGIYASNLPQGAEVFLLNPPAKEIEYSVFITRGFNILENTDDVRRLLDRADLKMKIVETSDLPKLEKGSIVFSIDEDGRISRVQN